MAAVSKPDQVILLVVRTSLQPGLAVGWCIPETPIG